MTRVHLGISTCPNDTFAFHGLLTGRSDRHGLDFQIDLLDVEELNLALLAGRFDVAKTSFATAIALGDTVEVLPVGAALGYGVGPVLLARPGWEPTHVTSDARVLCPGEHTTATLLYRLFHPRDGAVEQVVFSAIMPALRAGEADLGVCIHEGRFTYAAHGLRLVEDLGATWERTRGCALPLGGLVVRTALGRTEKRAIHDAIRASLEYGLRHRDETVTTMRHYAQELDDAVLFQHVDLYVSRATRDLGRGGRQALTELARAAVAANLLGDARRALVVFDADQ